MINPTSDLCPVLCSRIPHEALLNGIAQIYLKRKRVVLQECACGINQRNTISSRLLSRHLQPSMVLDSSCENATAEI